MSLSAARPPYPVGTVLLAAIAAGIYLAQLGSYALIEPDEGRYAEIAREMAEPGGDWLIPRLNGIPHFQKPPFFYWLTAGSIKLFGPHEFAARLPVALSAIGVLLLAMGIANRLFGLMAARLTLVILASSPLFLALGRTVTPDMTMTLWITAAIYCLTRMRGDRRWRWLFFVCAGAGFLTKGPVAFLVPFTAAIGYSISLRKAGRTALPIPWIAGLTVSILIGLSWFLFASARYPELFDYFWKYEVVERIGSTARGRSRPFWFFVPVLIGGFLPWTFVAVDRLPRVLKRRPAEFGLFAGWIAVPLLALSCSGSKLPTYVLPLFPGMAVALGAVLAGGAGRNGRAECLPPYVRAAMAMWVLAIAAAPIVVTRFVIEPAGTVTTGMVAWSILVAAGGIIWLPLTRRCPAGRSIHLLAGLVLLGLFPIPSHLSGWNSMLAQQASVKTLAQRILAEGAGYEKPPRVISCEIRANGLPFYLGRTVEITRETADIVPTPEKSDLAKSISTPLHENGKRVARIPREEGPPIYVVTRSELYEREFAEAGWRLLQTAGDFVLLRR